MTDNAQDGSDLECGSGCIVIPESGSRRFDEPLLDWLTDAHPVGWHRTPNRPMDNEGDAALP
jgi:hypothetical protein